MTALPNSIRMSNTKKAAKKDFTTEKELAKEVKDLAKEIHHLKDMEFIKILKHPGRLMWLSFIKGAFVGFGSILGASILLAIFAFIMTQISTVPLIGDYIKDIQQKIEEPSPTK